MDGWERCRGSKGDWVLYWAYREYMSETMSISASAWAIFCSEESWGWRPKRKDIVGFVGVLKTVYRSRRRLRYFQLIGEDAGRANVGWLLCC